VDFFRLETENVGAETQMIRREIKPSMKENFGLEIARLRSEEGEAIRRYVA